VQWYPRGGQEGWQPFLGIGANYTIFFDEETTKGLDGTLDAVLGASEVDLDLDNSFGLSAQAGVDIPFAKNWAISLAVWYIDLQTNATVSTDVGDVNFKTDINPFVYHLGIAHRF
jgi:outer membrane protein